MLLGTRKNSVNNACRGELGRHPIEVESSYKSIKYWTRLLTKEEDTLAKMSFLDSLRYMKPTIWAQKTRDKIFRMGFGFAWSASDHININRFLKDYKQRLKDISYQKWLCEMFNDNKTKNEGNKI